MVVALGWVFFRSGSLSSAGSYLASLFGANGVGVHLQVRPIHLWVGCVAALVVWATPTTQELLRAARGRWVLPLQVAFLLALIHLHHEDQIPFLYFQF